MADMSRAEMLTLIRTRPTVERFEKTYGTDGYMRLFPSDKTYKYFQAPCYCADPVTEASLEAQIKAEQEAWRLDIQAENARRLEEATRIAKEKSKARIAARATMTMEELKASLNLTDWFPSDATHIIKDDDANLTLATSKNFGKVKQIVVLNIAGHMSRPTRYACIEGEEPIESKAYDVDDGVLSIPNSKWAAMVIDPSAPKPVYDFLERCPGGYLAPNCAAGDILVWGTAPDRKGRKQRYDRLIYDVSETKLRAFACDDYVQARRLRKLLA